MNPFGDPFGLPIFNSAATNRSTERKVFWNRADVDGAPYRGINPPLLTDEEYAQRVKRVYEPKNATFYTGDPTQNAAYVEVLRKIFNSWAKLIWIDRWREPGQQFYTVAIEWCEFYMEDNTPIQDQPTGVQ